MKCPTCPDDTLVMTERSGIEIDYCAACRGVWLDRGELDKIIQRSTAVVSPAATQPASSLPDRAGGNRQRLDSRDDRFDDSRSRGSARDDDRFDDDHSRHRPKRRRESLLGELFDF